MKTRNILFIVYAIWIPALLVSFIKPFDMLTWWLEALPVLICIPLFWFTQKRFPLTPLLYWFVCLHGLLLILGAHYTYARVPLGFWMQETFDFSRNHYDRIGHFFQGFVPALAAREIFIRKKVIASSAWRFVLVVCTIQTVSVFYEYIEWASALILGAGAQEFLGTQGDPWDTQWDMFLACIGAILAQALLGKVQDRQMRRLQK